MRPTILVMVAAHSIAVLTSAGERISVAVAPEALDRTALVIVSAAELTDLNGDRDGYADTNETVDLRLTLSNKFLQAFTNVVVHLAAGDPKIDCIREPFMVVGNLPADADVILPQPFHLHVSGTAERGGPAVTCSAGACSNFVQVPGGCGADADCRRTPLQDYSTKLEVTIVSDQFIYQARPETVTLDLDLDTVYAAGATTTFAEGFEGTLFGSFQLQTLDFNKASNSASDGYRCQYTDPDKPDSFAYGEDWCYLGFANGQTPANDWHVHGLSSPDGGRAYLGMRSLHYGKHVDGVDTYALSQLDAIRTKSAIHLAARVCRDDPAPDRRACNVDADCLPVGSGPCVGAHPELSLKQQVAMVGERIRGYVVDKAVVHAQVSGSTIWTKIVPYENLYDVRPFWFADCAFDPIDDGNDEDSLFDPPEFFPRGPSSTCYPEFVFNWQGQTDGPYISGNTGYATDGPGLQGSVGPGTWVESRFDLSRFRGRSVLVRMLVSSLKLFDTETWEDALQRNPIPGDDGWYVDDVRVTQTLGSSTPTVTNDDRDNSGLPGDSDQDSVADLCDCAPADPSAFAKPSDVPGLSVGADRATISWTSLSATAGSGTVYDVVRGSLTDLPVGNPGETCVASGIPGSSAVHGSLPSSGSGFYYVVRGRNACGSGPYGTASDGTQRTSTACP